MIAMHLDISVTLKRTTTIPLALQSKLMGYLLPKQIYCVSPLREQLKSSKLRKFLPSFISNFQVNTHTVVLHNIHNYTICGY